MDKPEAVANLLKESLTLTEVLQLLEGIADSLNAIEAQQEKLESAVEDVKADTEEILNNLEDISFKADYPGLEE